MICLVLLLFAMLLMLKAFCHDCVLCHETYFFVELFLLIDSDATSLC